MEATKYNPFITVKEFGYIDELTDLIINKGFTGQIKGFQGGGRFAGKSQSMIMYRLKMLLLPKKVACTFARYKVDGAVESFGEAILIIENLNLHHLYTINRSRRTIKAWNGNTMRFVGYMSNTNQKVRKLGLLRGHKFDIYCLDIDEIFEFPDSTSVQDIVSASPDGDVLWETHMTNTWDELHWRLARATKEHPQNEHQLKIHGQQFSVLEKTDKLITYSHYTNHRINTFLSEAKHQMLLDLWKTDPRRARIEELGLFGISKGGVYSDYMGYIQAPPSNYTPRRFFLGVDVGFRKDATTAVLLSVDENLKNVAFHREYYLSDHEESFSIAGQTLPYRHKTQEQRANDIIKYAISWCEQLHNFGGLQIFVDTSGAFNEDLERAINVSIRNNSLNRDIWNFLSVNFTIKPPINQRIALYHYLMGNRRMYIDKEKCPNLFRELSQSLYKENQKTNSTGKVIRVINREDENDHCINASEYAFSEVFWQLLRQDKLFKKGAF